MSKVIFFILTKKFISQLLSNFNIQHHYNSGNLTFTTFTSAAPLLRQIFIPALFEEYIFYYKFDSQSMHR